MDFQLLAVPRNVSVDLVCACECLYMVYPFESGEVMALILYWWAEPHVATLHRECYRTL